MFYSFKLLVGIKVTISKPQHEKVNINIPGRPSVMSSMLFDLVGRGLALGTDGDDADDFPALLAGLPGPWLILESDLTLEGEAGALSSKDFFLGPF